MADPETTVFGVAKLRLGDSEKETRGQAPAVSVGDESRGETTVAESIAVFRERTRLDPSLAQRTRERRESAVQALLKTWPGLAARDFRRITAFECREWATRTLREGKGFVALRVKTKRTVLPTAPTIRPAAETSPARGGPPRPAPRPKHRKSYPPIDLS
jgi:hypothetical protein